MSLARRLFCRLTASHSRRSRTQFGLHESVGDSQVVSGDGLSVDHPEQSELGRQRVHDHRQVSLPHLSAEEEKPSQKSQRVPVTDFTGRNVSQIHVSKAKSGEKRKAFVLCSSFNESMLPNCSLRQRGLDLTTRVRQSRLTHSLTESLAPDGREPLSK